MQEPNKRIQSPSRADAGNKQRIQSPCRKQSDIPEPMHESIRLSRALAASNHIQSKPKQEEIKELRDNAGSNPTIQSPSMKSERR
jgi:hypothetical protein